MKNFFSIISLLIACLPSLAQQGTSMRSTNGIGFGVSTFNGPIAATNTLTTNQFAGKFRQGNGTRASGTSASAFGVGSVASGQFSFAEGLYTTAGNNAAHAEGSSNAVSGASAHAEGLFNEASGTASHVQGVQNVANGIASHASGRNVELQSGTDYTFGGGLNIIALGTISNSFLWNADWGNTMSPATGSVFMVDAPNGIFFDGNVYVSNGSLVGDGSGLTNLPPSAGVGAISYTVSGGGQAIVNGVYTNGTSTSWLHGGGPTATSLECHPGESPTWIFYNGATPLYSAEALTGPWTIEVGGLAPAPTVLVGGGNFGVFYGDGANLTNIGANSIKSTWASNVFAGGTLAVGSIVSSGTITGNGAGLTNLNAMNLRTGTVDNVLFYGADPTGVANSVNAFSNALLAVKSSGRALYVPAGSYILSRGLSWPDTNNVRVFGDGIGKSVLNFYEGTNTYGFTFPNSAGLTNAVIEDLSLIGNSKTNTGSGNFNGGVILGTNNINCRFSRLEIKTCAVGAINNAGGTCRTHGMVVEGCRLTDCGPNSAGYIFAQGDNIVLRDNVIDDTGNINETLMHAFYFGGGNNGQVLNNICIGSNANISVGANSYPSTNILIAGNLVQGVFLNTSLNLYDCAFVNNQFKNTKVVLQTSQNVLYSGNIFEEDTNAVNAIMLDVESSTNVSVIGNTFRSAYNAANRILLEFTVSGEAHFVSGNSFRGGSIQCLFSVGHNSKAIGNAFFQPQAGGGASDQLRIANGPTNIFTANNSFSRNLSSDASLYDLGGFGTHLNNDLRLGGTSSTLTGSTYHNPYAWTADTLASGMGVTNRMKQATVLQVDTSQGANSLSVASNGVAYFGQGLKYSTNTGSSLSFNFNLGPQWLTTNAAFAYLKPTGVDTAGTSYQRGFSFVTNSTAAVVAITADASINVTGLANVTNVTKVEWECYANFVTNAHFTPLK